MRHRIENVIRHRIGKVLRHRIENIKKRHRIVEVMRHRIENLTVQRNRVVKRRIEKAIRHRPEKFAGGGCCHVVCVVAECLIYLFVFVVKLHVLFMACEFGFVCAVVS